MKIMIALSRIARGGAENVAAVLANSFVKQKHEVFFVSDKSVDAFTDFFPLEEQVHLKQCFQGKNPFVKVFRLRRYIKEVKPDIILGIMSNASFMSYLASLGLKTVVIATEHNAYDRSAEFAQLTPKQYFFRFYLNRIYKMVSVLTEADKVYSSKWLSNVVVMPNPLSLDPISENNHNRQKRILAAGRIEDWHCKGFDLLIKAWGMIASKYPEWILEIAGAYNEKNIAEVRSIVRELGLENRVVFSGFHKNIAELYKASEIFVLSSRYEGFGMVLIEAMSQGCACVACDFKGRQREIIQNESQGICVNANVVEEIAFAIEKLIVDENYRANVQKNAIERSKVYASEKIAALWLNKFNDLLGKR